MIETVAEFLSQLQERESAVLNEQPVTHGPTIGDMFEGLSKDLLNRAVPPQLGLRVVSGFIMDGQGNQSGQIDAMLVNGAGTPIPYTDAYIWHVRDVVAAFEVKKTLYGGELASAITHLRTVKDLAGNYVRTQPDDLRTAQDLTRYVPRAFAEATGLVAPVYEEVGSLSLQDQGIFHTLLDESWKPLRIVLGYSGFQSEHGFRDSLAELLLDQVGTQGWGPTSFPHLIISGSYSLCKANGQPFSARAVEAGWPFYFSSDAKPIRLLLEYVWTRLDRIFGIGGLWGDDLTVEVAHGLLLAEHVEQDGKRGWNYSNVPATEKQLRAVSTEEEWRPESLSLHAFVAINRLCGGHTVSLADKDMLVWLQEEGVEVDAFREELLSSGLVALDSDEFVLITTECTTCILGDDFLAAENNTGRFTRWLAKRLDSRSSPGAD